MIDPQYGIEFTDPAHPGSDASQADKHCRHKKMRGPSGQTQEQVTAGLRGLAADRGTPCAPSPSKQQLSRWENGHESPGRLYGPLLGLWYRTTASRLGLAGDDPIVTNVPAPVAAEEDDVDRRQFLQLAAAAPLIPVLDETRRKMNADLRYVLPADEISRWSGAITDLPAALRVPLLVTQARAVAPAISALSPQAAGRYHEELTALTA